MEEEQNVAPSAEVSTNEPMSFDSALSILNEADSAPVEEQTAAPETVEAEGTGDEAEQVQQSDENSDETVDTASDAEPEAELVLHGNAKTRLRNGQEVTIGELKKRWEEAEEYKAKLPEFETRARELEQKQQAIAAQEQLFTQGIQQAQAILRAKAPPKPDYAAYERGDIDILTFTEQQAKWNAFAGEWQQLERARLTHEQQAQHRQAEAHKQWLQEQRSFINERAPELASDEALRAFSIEGSKVAKEHYGMTDEDLRVFDRGPMLLMARDAIAYRKLQAEKAKVAEKVKDVPPVQVQSPGRRVTPAEKQAQAVKQGFERLRKTGSFDDALAILNQLD